MLAPCGGEPPAVPPHDARAPDVCPEVTIDVLSCAMMAVTTALIALRSDFTQDGQALCLALCGVAVSAAVSAAVRAPWYVRRRAAVALGLRLLMAATLNVLVSQYRGPVRLLTGYVDWAMRRSTAMGALSVGALGVRLPPRRAATLAAAQAVLLLAAQRGACAGVRAAHPNCGTFYRPIAARLSDAARHVAPWAAAARAAGRGLPAVAACDDRACWAVSALTNSAALMVGCGVGVALGGARYGARTVAQAAAAALVGLVACWMLLEVAAPAAVPCG